MSDTQPVRIMSALAVMAMVNDTVLPAFARDGSTVELIWDPTYTTKTGVAHGLGLHLVKQMVTSDGGSVSCQSTPGEKTTFTVRLPMAASLLEQLGSDPDDVDAALSGGTSGSRLLTRASRLR